jgi:short-subunit dehydrogenase
MAKGKTGRISGGAAAAAGLAAVTAGVMARRLWRGAMSDRELPPIGRALITGASSGIGEAFARRLAAGGFDLALVARREERMQALAAELSAAHGIQAKAIPADLSKDEDVGRVARYIEAHPDMTLLINNAGFGTHGKFAEVELGRQLDMIHVHVIASVVLTRAALPGMIARGGGAIINVSSVAAFFPSGGGANYSASKVYLNNFSEALQAELDGTGVKVQALCPGFTRSEFHDTAEYSDFDRQTIPDALWLSAEQVVDESLAALSGDRVIVVPGRQYRGMAAAANSPLGGPLRSAARAVRKRWNKI